MKIDLTKSQCESLIDFIELNLLDAIRKSKDDSPDFFIQVDDILKARDTLLKVVLNCEEEE